MKALEDKLKEQKEEFLKRKILQERAKEEQKKQKVKEEKKKQKKKQNINKEEQMKELHEWIEDQLTKHVPEKEEGGVELEIPQNIKI